MVVLDRFSPKRRLLLCPHGAVRRTYNLCISSPNQRGWVRPLAETLGIAVLYYATGHLGRLAAPPPGIETVVWPPPGIALAALLIFGRRVSLGIWLGAFLSNNWAAVDFSGSHSGWSAAATGVSIDTGALLQALLGAELVRRRIGDRNPFERVRDTLTFVGIAMGMCLVSSSWGVASLCMGGALDWGRAFSRWSNWWIGDTGGVLVIAPAILSCWHLGRPQWDRARWREVMLLFAAVVLLATAIFIWWEPAPPNNEYPAEMLLLPLIAWVAVRFTQREVTLAVLAVLGIALAGTVHGRGLYGSSLPWTTLPVLQAFIGILSILSLSIGAAIAERKRTEEALQASEAWLKESQRISRLGSYVLDFKTGKWGSSVVLDEIFGIDASYHRTVEGWVDLVHPDDRQSVRDYFLKEVVGQQKPFDREYRIIAHNDGRVRWVHGIGELQHDQAGRLATMAGTIQDITEHKQLESQLRQAHKMESIGRLAGGVAHDFNNLLTVINGYSELTLDRMSERDPLRTHVLAVRKAGERASALTKQLLAFSRRQLLQPRVLDLNTVVAESETILLRLIEENIQFVTVLAPSLGMVRADPTQLTQILLNLVVNARDAMPDGGLLRVETANVNIVEGDIEDSGEIRAGGYVMLEVSDSGTGMDEETRRHLFEPFFTTKGPGRGTGLGLATVYGIVKQSGGHIQVESAPRMGTTIRIYLRRVEAVEPETLGGPAAVHSRRSSGTVLLVEDQDSVRRYVALVLREAGYFVIEADSGSEALAAASAQEATVDLLITDVVMPGLTGPALAAELKPRFPALRVLYMSGYTNDIADRHGVFDQTGSYIQKPFGADALSQKVREVLGAEQEQRDQGAEAGR